MKRLAEVFQHNQQVFTGGFELVEMHHFVQRRVMNDLFIGNARFTHPVLEDGETVDQAFTYPRVPGRHADSKIDWDWYYTEFKRCVAGKVGEEMAAGVREFCGVDMVLPAPEPAVAPAPAKVEGQADMVFGGDYAGQ